MSKTLKTFIGIVSATPILFLLWLIVSFLIYLAWPHQLVVGMSAQNAVMVIGGILIIAGTALAFWAQRISRKVTDPNYKAQVADLMQGPYRFSRHPGSLSLMIMSFGFALVVNSLAMLLLGAMVVILLTTVFVPLEEQAITELCPEAYTEYKTRVRMWL